MTQTRWNHLSDRELWGYKDLITGDQDSTLVEELFNRLEKKIAERKELDDYREGKKPETPEGYLL